MYRLSYIILSQTSKQHKLQYLKHQNDVYPVWVHGCFALVCMCEALRSLYTFIPVSTNSLLHYLVSIQTCLTICVVSILPSGYRKYFILVIPIIRQADDRSLHIFTYHRMQYRKIVSNHKLYSIAFLNMSRWDFYQ